MSEEAPTAEERVKTPDFESSLKRRSIFEQSTSNTNDKIMNVILTDWSIKTEKFWKWGIDFPSNYRILMEQLEKEVNLIIKMAFHFITGNGGRKVPIKNFLRNSQS